MYDAFLSRSAFGVVAATGGACLLWMLGLHCSTASSCRAFSMLTMLSLDAGWCSPEGKVLLRLVSALAPLFPPKQTAADYMRAVRDYRAQHGSGPVEHPDSAGYGLAKRIRTARAAGVFDAAELAELDSLISASAAAKAKPAGAVAAVAKGG